jgi:hypothetical protein
MVFIATPNIRIVAAMTAVALVNRLLRRATKRRAVPRTASLAPNMTTRDATGIE